MMNTKTKNTIVNVICHIGLALLGFVWLIPIAWLIMHSFRGTPTGAFPSAIFPETWTLDNYIKLFTETHLFNYPRWFMNTLVVAILSCKHKVMPISVRYRFLLILWASSHTRYYLAS